MGLYDKGLISLLCKESLKIKVKRVTTKRKKKSTKGPRTGIGISEKKQASI